MDIPQQSPRFPPEEADTVSPLSGSPLLTRRQRESVDSMAQQSTLRKISWHSSTSTGTNPSADRRQQRAESNLSQRSAQDPPPAEVDDNADETTAILKRVNGGTRNYNTQDSAGNDLSNTKPAVDGANDRVNTTQSDDETLSWWRRTVEKYGSVELENKGSVARDHLALERTFLAWLRTSLSFASIGIAVTQLFRLNAAISPGQPPEGQLHLRQAGKPLGATFIAIGIATLLVGFHRYFESQHYVILGKFPASRGSIVLVSLLSVALIVASFIVILTVSPTALGSS